MKGDPLVLRIGSGVLVLFLFLLSPVLRAEDAAAEESLKTNAQIDPVKGDLPKAKTEAKVQEQAVPRTMTKEALQLKLIQAKYDADGDGKLDDKEKNRMNADLEMWAKKYKQALAKYDANKNGVLDQEEKAKMRQDEVLADRNERNFALGQARMQQKLQQNLRKPPPRDIVTPRPRRP